MKTKKNIDDLIKQSLNKEDARFYDNLDELSIFETFGSIFKGKNKWVTIYVSIVTLAFFIFMIYSVIKLFEVQNTNDMLKWGIGAMLSFITVGFIKAYYWMEMNKNVLLREIKRLELQITLLANKTENK